ncbi:serine/threonine protein kinase [Flexivirga endophytica]|uniref:non-specific serine/threonine protein kinase n=1 Tax=Flexivirga endophytica TaxID=1849103 RepID=A0A916T028_9MICO|nr:Stk1 family PASTA domain-containing Ser/Thr kinase [Flexivirga endophytica]GGB22462.1 serine/threonine protein kinase [Flexivirga endophytica]GHB56399.1 serine/threonine protein kinase [Flexivirga endophytica]
MTDGLPRILGGRYEIGELIGRGGMAEVHLGHDNRLGRTVAIKILRADLARDSTFLTRFRREAHSAAGLSHHSIVAVYDSGEDTFTETGGAEIDVPYIVMEYVDGQTLREILNEEGKLSSDEAARVTMGILSALEYSHDKGIVHRDIKPANVMLTKGGSVKVMDFGIARALADNGATMTSAQAVVGTARYLSPEQAQGETVDARSDLYSAGCVLYELLTGRTPFVGEPVSLVYQHITDPPKPPSAYEPSVPKAMNAVTLHSLAKGRDERYQTAGDFRADLQAARTGAPLSDGATAVISAAAATAPSVMDREPQAPPPEPRRRDHTREIHDGEPQRRLTGLWVVAGIIALLAILGIGYLVMNGGKSDATTEAVPNVVQQKVAAAKRILHEHGFDNYKVNLVKSDVTKGYVARTDPTSGTKIDPKTQILLNVSDGPGLTSVPDVTGKSVAEARKTLTNDGFAKVTVANQKVDDTKYPAGQVVSAYPAIGSMADPSQRVTLSVSSGKVHVPTDLVGKESGEAQLALLQAHLQPEVKSVPVSDPDQGGKVQKVSPGGGNKVDANSTVTLSVGVYSSQTTVTITPPPPPDTTEPSDSSSPSSTSSSSPSSSSESPTSKPSPTHPGTGSPTRPKQPLLPGITEPLLPSDNQ